MRFDNFHLCKYNSSFQNDITYQHYFNLLKQICMMSIEWVNLPPTCNERMIELSLFDFGYVLFFKHKLNEKIMSLPCTFEAGYNMYYEPVKRRAYAVTGFSQSCDDSNSVLCYNNYLRTPSWMACDFFARRLTEIRRAMDVNIKAQKTPVLIRGTEPQMRALNLLYKKYDGNTPVIFGDKELDVNALTVLKTDAPESYINLNIQFLSEWASAMTYFGINNEHVNKKERLITDEVDSINEQLGINRELRVQPRRECVNAMNQLFAPDLEKPVYVRFRNLDIDTFSFDKGEIPSISLKKEGEYEPLHD